VLTKVEDLTVLSRKMEPVFSALVAAGDDTCSPSQITEANGLHQIVCLDVPALIQCAKTRKERSQPLGEVTIVFEEPKVKFVEGVELLGGVVGESTSRVSSAPRMSCTGEYCKPW